MKETEKNIALRLKAIIDTAIDAILTIDRKGIVETLNPAAARIFGYSPEEVIGNNISMLMPEPTRSEHNSYIDRYVETRKPKIIGIGREVVGRKKDGKLIHMRLAVSEVVLNDRIIFTGILHDLTEVKEAQDELVSMNEILERKVEERTVELEEVVNRLLDTNIRLKENERELQIALDKEMELSELKSRFVSMASHEFRTPLSTILSSAALINRYTNTDQADKREKHVKRIKSAVVNLTGILNDFLSLSKLEEGLMEVVYSEFDLNDLCNIVVDEIEGLLKENQHIRLQHTGPSQVKTDLRILKNILFNIVSNAIKYSGENTVIYCIVEVMEESITFEVQDEGIGIPKAEQKHLFNRFFRASNVETIQGTGLGLNIVQQYLALLDGKIWFVSEEGKGTTFYIRIPRKDK